MKKLMWLLGMGVVCGWLAGCATSNTVQSRKQERLVAYEALSPEFKAAVDQGSLKVGMNMDAVYIAWGRPSQTATGGSATGETITWVYQGGYVQESRFWGGYRMHYAYTPVSYVRAQVVFRGGLVSDWQTFPQPLD